jgi:dynein heavy chain
MNYLGSDDLSLASSDSIRERSAADYDQMVAWMHQKLDLLGFGDPSTLATWNSSIVNFITGEGPKVLSVLRLDNEVRMRCDNRIDAAIEGLRAYFIRSSNKTLSVATMNSEVQYGTVNGFSISTLERVMKGLVEKQVSNNTTLTDGARLELTGHFHRCMAVLTDSLHVPDGRTVLYCPAFEFESVGAAAADKDLVQLMQAIVIHWTRQIKGVVNNHDNSTMAESSGPLEEIEFWKGRAQDFLGIQVQLQSAEVQRIIEVLNYAKSNYLGPFNALTKQIEARAAEANDNLKYLESIRPQCTALREIEAEKVVSIIPDLLNRIRLIWSFSQHYSSEERVCGILRKVSNEIIRRFRNHVPLEQIFDGDVEFCIGRLQDSISCGIEWKALYHRTVASIQRQKNRYGRSWEIDEASVFAQIDAFVQRCRDLIEVCECQMQFARKSAATGGKCGPLPDFGGTKAQEIVDGITGIQMSFELQIDRLRQLDYNAFDVRVSRWHDDYNHFKNAAKDLEVMYTILINAAFDNISSIADGVSLAETFLRLAKRDMIQRCVEKKISELHQTFLKQVQSIRSEFEHQRMSPPLRSQDPKYAGSALWAHGLATTVSQDYQLLSRLTNGVNERDVEDAKEACATLVSVTNEFKKNRYEHWIEDLSEKAKENGLQKRLDIPILRRLDPDASLKGASEIVCNFDEELLVLFAEVRNWQKFHVGFNIPYAAHDICNSEDSMRVLRERVMTIVRAYNDIVRDISSDERRLFTDYMRKLDRRMNQGMTKLTWQSRNLIEMYVRDACAHCVEVHNVVREFKECKAIAARACKYFSSALLIKVDKNVIYEGLSFESYQKDYRTQLSAKFSEVFKTVSDALKKLYRNFADGPPEVLREWKSQINHIDKSVEHALKHCIKRSLNELSKAINGDSRTDPQTLFTTKVILDQSRIALAYKPSIVNLTHSVNLVAKDLIGTILVIPRVKHMTFDAPAAPAATTAPTAGAIEADDQVAAAVAVQPDKSKTYYEMISDDNDVLKVVVQIMNGMSATATELQKYLSYWDKYKALWEMDKDAYIRKYAKANRGPSQFDADITRYKNLQQEIQSDAISHTVNFVRADCSSLKDSLVGHAVQCQIKLSGLLNQIGADELKDIFSLIKRSAENLTQAPNSLNMLSEKIALHKDLKDGLPQLKSRFEPVREIYNTLARFEVTVKDEEMAMLQGLDVAYDEHISMLQDSDRLLEKCKMSMKRDLEGQMDGFTQQLADMRSAAQAELPFSDDKDPREALALIEAYKTKLQKARERDAALSSGLGVFGITPPDYKDLTATEKELDLLSQIWGITIDWNTSWDQWKAGQFNDLNVEELENISGNYLKKVGKLGREIKRWKVWEKIKTEIDKFKETIPLIQDLRSKAMRPRHWIALQERIGKEFDHNSSDFTLNTVMKLGLTSHAEFIGELSGNANKELAIEKTLNDLEKRWESIALDVGIYKDKYFKLRTTEDLSQSLEDDSVALSTIKASKFYSSFAPKIDMWENTLSTISEVVDSLLGVQRKWIYLESIFMSGGDISKQLPQEHSLFVNVNNDFLAIMMKFYHRPNAQQSCLEPGLLAIINKMDEGLEKIQKSLDQYLETKRMVFPRFYFVSDDDLLEILGQSKDPMAVQKHIKKCFEGIKSLKMIAPGGTQKTFEASHMLAPDGEVAAFAENVVIDGAVELWLVLVEKAMRRGISKLLQRAVIEYKGKKEKWVKDTIGQLTITTGSIVWTTDCSKALVAIANGSKNALREQKKKQVSYLNKLTTMIRGQLSSIERNKVVALITMEIHNRDVIEKMIKANCASVNDFEWLSQLRFVYLTGNGDMDRCEVRQTNSVLEYSCEYQGNNGRLVVTPLTDRCVLTLITAMYLNRGGNPLGPAGTGKTETVKDLGKNLAKYVVVINCSDGMDYKSVGRIFSGLVQSGSWGCFDEFNRIKIEVISVVAMQILSILNALQSKLPQFSFMGATIPCNLNCGIFITMNPGYAGRTELPDNLKALMRPVAMMAPDLTMIAEVMLASEGFNEARVMAKKTVTMYSLMVQQLSKQDHYDYGLRNLKAVLNMAGQLKRSDPAMSEETILMRALRDMNLPKFIKDDERLFRLLLGDLFPNLELPQSEHGDLQVAIETELNKAMLQKNDFLVQKIFQFKDSRATRHCNMLVGGPMGGKSTVWKMLAAAQTNLCKAGVEGYQSVTPYIISPKSIELHELYGAYDLATFEWKDGILSTIFKACSDDEKPFEKWMLFDGPIDALWIESMNSVMDDNKILTLINGDRIPLTPSMSLVFETQDLRVASPATVSRAGMIYIDDSEMDWNCYVLSWLQRKHSDDEEFSQFIKGLFDKWVVKTLKYKEANCVEPVRVSDFNAVSSLCTLFDAVCKSESMLSKEVLGETYNSVLEKLFVFSLVWTIGAGVDETGRKKFGSCLADIDSFLPIANSIYDYQIDVTKNDFVMWETKVPSWRPQKGATFHDMIVPTVDTVRNGYVVETYMGVKKNVLIVGNTGTGKTVLASSLLKGLPETHSQLVVNFSATTSSSSVQEIIEGPMEKRSKDKLGPLGGKQLVVFIDDFNMPKLTSAESPFQPPLELIRLWIDYGGWYDRIKCSWKFVVDSQLLVAMGPPGGGRNQICARTQSRFALLNLTFPSNAMVVRIFDSILSSKFNDYDPEVRAMSPLIALATLNVYKAVSSDFLATPEKFHYLFNIRDVAKVIQGILMAKKSTVYSPEGMARLWVHECQRVFADRFVRTKTNDEQKFRDLLAQKMTETMQKDWNNIMQDCMDPKVGPVFCGIINEPGDDGEVVYEEICDVKKAKAVCEERLEDYNMEPKLLPMHLAMFKDAILHVCRIHRVLVQPRGNIMLVGVGGSGRSSLARLATYIAGMSTFSIEITKNYRLLEFREDIKKLYQQAGCENKKVVFLLNDTQIKAESFLEDVNNILSSGVVPNLFLKDEVPPILDAVRKPAIQAGKDETSDALWNFFIDRVRSNLHVILAMSPIGDSLRYRCRMYPGLVNSTTIDWFHVWPAEALQEVAAKFLAEVPFPDDSYRIKISSVFADMHLSVIAASNRMLLELKRHNYVTPTNYLELVKGYRTLLAEKSGELGSSAKKLRDGLQKLEDAQQQVEVLSKQLVGKKVIVAQSQKDCEDLLVQIVSERRVADEQRRQVEADSDRITIEAAECKAISDDAEADLAIALPALEKAMEEVEKLDKASVSEVKAYTKPPPLVETVLQAVMILFGKATDWGTAKKVISESNFLQQIKGFDRDHVAPATNMKIKKFIDMPNFTKEEVKKVSGAAAALCVWVRAIFLYANVAKEVAPKRQRLKEATESLAMKQASLKEAQDALAVVSAKIKKLQESYDGSVGEKNRLKEEAEGLEAKLDRADKLVKGLSGEYVRWQESIQEYNASLLKVTGDALIAAAFLSYAGPFETSYRTTLQKAWMQSVVAQKIDVTDNFDFVKFLAVPTDVRDWNIQGLPSDSFSTENGVICTRGSRWPLMIDPQGQANRWIRNMEGSRLRIIDLKMSGFLREVENAVQYGFPVLLQDISTEIDPALEPVLSKSVMKIGNRIVMRIGDKELDYSPDFKLYITTKLSNPHYTPEISTKAAVVNFAVKKDGLEAQLLGIVVQKEEPELEKQKSELTIQVAAGKRQLVELENEILRLLSESKGSLLDDAGLVNTLQQSKITSSEVSKQLKIAEDTEKKIDAARMGYRTAAIRASLAYFVLDDMGRVDPMYQFSLDSYVSLFIQSIENSKTDFADIAVAKRCDDINTTHTLAVYEYTCRGLFEAHKLLFSLQLCFRIMESLNNLPMDEFNFFAYGGGLIDRSMQKSNPGQGWLSQGSWDAITELDKLASMQGIVSSIEQMPRDWKAWFMSSKPEDELLPADWSNKCSELQKLCLIRAMRTDRVLFSAIKFIAANIGPEFTDPPSFNLKAVYDTSTNKTPLIFVLSPGVDPTSGIFQLAAQLNQKVENCALGQGQAPTAMRMIEDGLKKGNWVFLANCHLMLSWMPTLEKTIETYIEGRPHPNFRLWLSSSPDPQFPITVLQRGIKMTTEPPKGLRSNLLTLYNTIGEEQFNRCQQRATYKKLLFSLVWFHAILLERRKFKSLGFNIPYDFNESDFAICHDLIIVFLDEYPDKIPFDAMKYLIAEANYGGRVTDDFDRRLVNVYISEFICENAVSANNFQLSELPEYYIPEEGDLQYYKDFIKNFPLNDHPLAFGQHPNADISSQIDDANTLIEVLVSLQPSVIKAASDESGEDPLAKQCSDLVELVPEPFDVKAIRERMEARSDPDPLKTVLYQELDRYNGLLSAVRRTLKGIVKAVQGLVAVTTELEEVMIALTTLRVPKSWSRAYPSIKPLGSWITDLGKRCDQLTNWTTHELPKYFWLPGFTYPTGFLTAVLQTCARTNGVAIDALSWEFPVLTHNDTNQITAHPAEGVFVTGLYVEGASWHFMSGVLEEPRPMELVTPMPIIHFKPVEGKRKVVKGLYSCPLYMYPVRTGTRERPSYVVSCDIKVGRFTADFWTKRGVALLLATAQ